MAVVRTAPNRSPAPILWPFATWISVKLLYTVRNAPCEIMRVSPAPGIGKMLEIVPSKTDKTVLPFSVVISMPLLSMVMPGRVGCACRPNFPVTTPLRTGHDKEALLLSKAAETILPSGVRANSPAELARSALSSASMMFRMAWFSRSRSACACLLACVSAALPL